MALAPGEMVTANVRLARKLAAGGMGSVWVADHLALDTEVAVKFISAELTQQDPTLIERFEREAKLAARIKSPHVVQTFDHGVMADGTPYIIMELLEGEPLSQLIERRGALAPEQVATIVAQVGSALGKAHDLGIIHRDIKPDNIVLADADYALFAKVLDFGIAKQAKGGRKLTQAGAMLGTLHYMAPEAILTPAHIDHRADLWSLAVVAYHMLTGGVPFFGAALQDVVNAICSGRFKLPSEREAHLSRHVDTWFTRALAHEPDQRFASAKELIDSFNTVTRGGPVPFRPAAAPQPAPQSGSRAALGDAPTAPAPVLPSPPPPPPADRTPVPLPLPRPIRPAGGGLRSRLEDLGWWLGRQLEAVPGLRDLERGTRRRLATGVALGLGTAVLLFAMAKGRNAICAGAHACQAEGRCTGAGMSCVAGEIDDCRRSTGCREDGRCSLSEDGRSCVVKSDDDCARAAACTRHGRCSAEDGVCREDDNRCRRTPSCRFVGHCTLQGDKCLAATDGDCAEARICKDSQMCQAVGGECVKR